MSLIKNDYWILNIINFLFGDDYVNYKSIHIGF